MKSKILHIYLFIGMQLICSFSIAQNINVVEENDLKFQTYFFEALKQKAIKNYSKAIESLEKCYELDSTNMGVQFELSKNNLLLSNFYEAEIFIDKALSKQEDNIYLLQHKMSVFKKQRRFNEAIEIQKEVVKFQPKEADKLVLLYIQNREFDKAEKIIVQIERDALSTQRIKVFKNYLKNRKIIKKPEGVVKLNDNVGLVILKKEFDKSKDYKTLLKIITHEVKNNLFEMLYNDSKVGLELFPAQPLLYKINGLALNNIGKYNEAIDVLTLGIDFVIDNNEMEAGFYDELSKSYKGLKKDELALEYKQKANNLRKGIK
jgi:tetratricopeptide (TPR) repeat protein